MPKPRAARLTSNVLAIGALLSALFLSFGGDQSSRAAVDQNGAALEERGHTAADSVGSSEFRVKGRKFSVCVTLVIMPPYVSC